MHIMLLCLSLAACSFSALARDQYQVRFDNGLETVVVRACFEGRPPERLYHNTEAGRFTAWIKAANGNVRIKEGARSLRLGALAENSCLEWKVNIGQAADLGDRRLAMRVGRDLLMEADLWFWKGPMERDIEVSVGLPAGVNFSTPWTETGRSKNTVTFRPGHSPSSWSSHIAIGHFPIIAVAAPGTEIRLAAIGPLDDAQREKFSRWIGHTAATVSAVYGRFPQSSPQVLVVPIGPRSEPVPWAHIMRGGGLAAEFFVDETRPLADFNADWTACHELSHMLLPFITRRDRWLSEGLASYYQNVLRARAGDISEKQAWQRLFEGFGRGQAGTHGGTLAQATQEGWGATMRVYWSGAAMMLLADTRLRALPESRQSLDSALQALQSCCLDNGKTWRAVDLLSELDRITGTQIFSSLYREHVHSEEFPDMGATWQELGIKTRFNRVRMVPDAPLSAVREAIMKG